MNLIIKQKQAHRLREGTYGYQQGRVSGGIDWEFGTHDNLHSDMYTLLCVKWIINKDLLNSTENTAQYSVIT